MRKFTLFMVVCLCSAILLSSALPVSAQEESFTVEIRTVEELLELAENCRIDSYSKNLTVSLRTDIDLTGTNFSGIPIFSGTFEGNGHSITGLQMDADGSNTGLFRYLTDTAVVRQLHVAGTVSPGGSGSIVGGIAGNNSGLIENCTFSGKVSGIDSVGGLVGINHLSGIISGCSVNGSVYGNHFAGGIAGDNYGVIRDSKNHAQVNTTIEQNQVNLEDITLDSLLNSESAATITDIGGICGTGTGVIRGCDNYGEVGYPQIGYNIGGIAGSFSGYIYNCKNRAAIDGRKEVGGIVGQLEPSVSMIYEEDTLQTLQQQMDDLSGITSGAGAHLQSGSSALNSETQKVEKKLEDARKALDVLIPDSEDTEIPDEDTLEAARNSLSSSLSDITASLGSMAAISESTLGALYGDLQGISNQMNVIGGTIGSASENLGGSISDISDADTIDDISSKIHGCTNLGNVQGDWNVGGITGAIGPENDLDPESDLQLIGNSSLNFDMQLRAVVLDCKNKGQVLGKKQNTGGIAGWMSMGLVKACTNTATVDAQAADYAGGIAGQSLGYIRSCNVKSAISGETYVGGIAGLGSTVTDCHVIALLSGATEKCGAILGSMEEATLEGNYYLPVSADPGAVDGISYDTMAQPLPEDQFFSLEALPSSFKRVVVTFEFDDATSKSVSLSYGSILSPRSIPAVPENVNSETVWVGPIAPGEKVFFDMTFTLQHTPHLMTLESDLKSSSALPALLAQGEFLQDAVFTAYTLEESGAIAAWSVTLPESQIPIKLRCLLPEGCDAEHLQLLVKDGGTWKETDFTLDGSYLVCSVSGQTEALKLVEIPVDYTVYIIGGVAFAATAAVITVITLCLRKKKSKK